MFRVKVKFTPQQLKKKVNAASFRSLGQAAGAIRLTAKRSIRKRKKPSNPGSPPSSPTGMLRRVLRYEVNRERHEPSSVPSTRSPADFGNCTSSVALLRNAAN